MMVMLDMGGREMQGSTSNSLCDSVDFWNICRPLLSHVQGKDSDLDVSSYWGILWSSSPIRFFMFVQ